MTEIKQWTEEEIDKKVAFLSGTLIPDLMDSGTTATAEDFQECLSIIAQLRTRLGASDGLTDSDKEAIAAHRNAEYVEDRFPEATTNEGWAIDEVDRTYATKVYGYGVVTTRMEPPFTTTYDGLE